MQVTYQFSGEVWCPDLDHYIYDLVIKSSWLEVGVGDRFVCVYNEFFLCIIFESFWFIVQIRIYIFGYDCLDVVFFVCTNKIVMIFFNYCFFFVKLNIVAGFYLFLFTILL